MKKLIRIFVFAIVALGALLAVAALGLTLYVQSPATQSKIEEKLSHDLGMPLKISGLSASPLGGLRIQSALIPQTDTNAGGGNFLEAGGFVARFKLLPLFSGRLEVTSLNVAEPKVNWTQDARGKWRLPALAKTAVAEKAPPKPKTEPAKKPIDFTISHFLIHGGAFDFLDAKHARVASFTGLDIDSPSITADSATGTAHCAATSIQDVVFPKNFQTAFEYKTGGLHLSKMEAVIAGGRISGNLQIDVEKIDSPFVADFRLENVDVNRLVVEGGGQTGQITGMLGSSLNFQGTTRDTDSITGSGRITLQNGHIRENEILQLIGQLLQIEDLVHFDLREAQADFHVSGGKVRVDQIVLQSENLRLTGKGTIRIDDGKLNLEARLTVNEKLAKKVHDEIASVFTKTDDGTGRYIDFPITGTLSKPRTDLDKRLIGSLLGEKANSFLESLGFKKKDKDKDEKKKKKKDQHETIAPQPASAADPRATTAVPPPLTPEK